MISLTNNVMHFGSSDQLQYFIYVFYIEKFRKFLFFIGDVVDQWGDVFFLIVKKIPYFTRVEQMCPK